MSEPVPLWLDCDPGHDDTFAILLAAYHPHIQLLGISTVHGNASLEKTTRNALSVLSAIGKLDDVPVHQGAAQALHRAPIHAPTDIHGESGLDGTALLPPPPADRLAAVIANASASASSGSTTTTTTAAMAAALRATKPGTAWIAATGSMTNVAALFQAHPDLAAHIGGLSIMGGSVGDGFTAAVMGQVDGKARVGNYTPWAEFNILIDPEAAAELFGNETLARKTTLVPLDLTHLVLATREVQDLLLYGPEGVEGKEGGVGVGEGGGSATAAAAVGAGAGAGATGEKKAKSELRVMLIELLNFFAATYRDTFGIVEGPPLHDPLAVAAVLAGTGAHEIPFYDYNPAQDPPSRRERFAVEVITEGTLDDAVQRGAQTGRTVVKLLPPGSEGVRIPRGLDIPRFWREIEACCQRADEVNRKKRLAAMA
ncbi:Inosine/uridine-preferring nucleoside hydrolase [Hypoxylon fragiforme]|uniref:Inosine/uridine-preferring nucleoside hydrolase n=1 Tax=Hypoxylon fragiforme TaxID=63214 RepID=UPI0020C729FA|nr:Inosine/uridine-preferring nucleoside hydrolase [Hypoxylon fragiforme]KAI2613586.1 Inosine/uridine-preferring nucleoside hydrolase [Hypoxylon fragiforme]